MVAASLILSALAIAQPLERPTELCYYHLKVKPCPKFGPPQRMRGVWYYGFEESDFLPNVADVPLVRTLDEVRQGRAGILRIDWRAAERTIGLKYTNCPQAIAIEFVGRQSFMPDEEDPNFTVFTVDELVKGRVLGTVRTKGLRGFDSECDR